MPSVEAPITSAAIPSSTKEKVWIFPFGLQFDRAVLDPSDLNFDLDLDTSASFSTFNAKHLTKTSAVLSAFQNGDVGKAFEVELPGRSNADVTWYWRVRINNTKFVSARSDIRSFRLRKRRSLTETQAIFDRLADGNAYSKEANSSNTYKLLLQAGRELDALLYEKELTITDLVLDTARDTAMVNNFSELLGLERVATEPAAHHRWKTVQLWNAFTKFPGTERGMIKTVEAFVAETPTFIDLTSTEGWILGQNILSVPSHPEIQPIIVVYSRPQRGHSFVINVWNSWDLTYDADVLERFIKRQKPAHAQMTINYVTNRNWSLRYNRQWDWEQWTNSGNCDVTSYPGTVRLNAGTTNGTLTSPVERIETVNGYDAPYITKTTSGQTVTVEYRTSANNSAFTPWTTLNHGETPDSSVAIQAYIQFRVTLSRTASSAPNPILESFDFRGTRT